MKNKKTLLFLLLVVGVVYFNGLFSGFVWSDKSLIIGKQEFFSHARNALTVLASPDMGLEDRHATPYYRPLNTLTYMLDSHLWGLNPFWYHLENVLLHALVAALFYLLLVEVFEDRRLAFIASVLFAVYPVNAEAVDAIFNRNVILCAFFSLVCLICIKKGGLKWTVVSLLAYCLALLSKEPAVILPFFLLSYVLAGKGFVSGMEYLRAKNKKTAAAGFFAITVLYFIIRYRVLGAFTSEAGVGLSLARLQLISSVYFEHFRLMIFPFKLNANYTVKWLSFSWSKAAGAVFGVLLLVYFSLARKIPGPVRAGALWIFWGLLPVSNIVKIPSAPVAEKYEYTIILGFCLILGYLLSGLHDKKKRVGAAVIVALALALGLRTFERNFVWQDDTSLYSSMTSVDPGNAVAHCNLGSVYAAHGDLDKAALEFETALSLNRGLSKAWMDLGVIYSGRGLFPDSERLIKIAIALDPGLAEARLDLGATYAREGRLPDSVRELKEALALDPRFAQARLDLGIIYDKEGHPNEAIREYRMAIGSAPGLLKAHLLLGMCYQKEGFFEEAAGEFQNVLKLDPGNAQAMNGLNRDEGWSEK